MFPVKKEDPLLRLTGVFLTANRSTQRVIAGNCWEDASAAAVGLFLGFANKKENVEDQQKLPFRIPTRSSVLKVITAVLL